MPDPTCFSEDHLWLTGVIADMPSPFDADDNLDLGAFKRLCEQEIAVGANALLVGETAGEMATLTADEHDVLVRLAVETSRRRIRVVSGAGSNSTSQAIELTQRAGEAGADAVKSVAPYYNKPTQAGIEAHFTAIADATKLLILLHDNPQCCVRGLADDTLIRLSRGPHFIGLRDGSRDIGRPLRIRSALPADFKLLSGDDSTAMSFILHGGDGLISAIAAIVPELNKELFLACKRNEVVYASAIADRLTPLSMAIPSDGAPAFIKYALALRGLIPAGVRLPMVALQSRQKAAIADAMTATFGPSGV